MDLAEFDFHLPEELIAQQPLEDRAASRMLVVHRAEGRWEDRTFREFPQFLNAGDVLAINDSKVLPARLFGRREGGTGGHVEVLLERAMSPDHLTWRVLARPGRKLRTHEKIRFSERLEAEIIGRSEFGERLLRFHATGDFFEAVEQAGHMPLPPYIRRPDTPADRTRYQTVYARDPGSAAAPTAGLHFTPQVLEECAAAGAQIARVTLHVGLGTFQPIRAASLDQVKLHAESWSISVASAALLRAAPRVLAVGTTSVRTVETAAAADWQILSGDTDLFIRPGFVFRRVNAMLTNFHLPQSSLLILVCAFGGRELILDAYQHAVRSGYRFYSYGDCMLIV